MWEKLRQFARELLTLKRQVKDNTLEIEELRKELQELTGFVSTLNRIVNQDRTRNEAQQEILIEKLKNAFLKFENDLMRGNYPNMLKNSEDEDQK